MTPQFDDVAKIGKEFFDTSLKSIASVSKSAQAISTEASSYAKKTFEGGSAAVEKLMSAGSVEKAVELQAEYAKSAYEGFVAEATKMVELYADMAKDAYKPFESIVAKAA